MALTTYPPPRIPKHPHPRTVRFGGAARPAHLHVAEHALGVRHQHGEAAVGGGHGGEAVGAAVGVVRVGLGGLAAVVHEAHRAVHGLGVAALAEVGNAFAVRHRDRDAAAGHALEEQARAVE